MATSKPGRSAGRDKPWLRTAAWRMRRGVVYSSDKVRGRYIVLAGVFFVGPFLLIALIALFGSRKLEAEGYFALFLMIAMMSALVGVLSYGWWKHRRYGDSVCRLITLPGLIDGPFAADVDCALPPDAGKPVVVRLKNLVRRGRSMQVAWQMEQKLDIAVSGPRTVVPVRLSVPRHPDQVMPDPDRAAWKEVWLGVDGFWILEIEKEAAGIDFKEAFVVPVYDLPRDAAKRP